MQLSLNRRLLYAVIVAVLLGSACTATPTPEVTPTEVPVLPLPEHLPLEGRAIQPATWPDLPADLFFLRDGQLWRWPAGGEPEVLVKVLDSEITDYRVTPDGETVAYLTRAGKLGTVNRKTGDQVRVTLPHRLAYVGFSLAPNGAALSVSDAEGLWWVALPSGETEPLLGNPESASGTTMWLPEGWSADGRWLLANLKAGDNYALYLIDVQSGRFRKLQEGCLGEVPQAAWSSADRLWLSTSECGAGGELVLTEIASGADWSVLRHSPQSVAGKLTPFGWMAMPGDRLAFANYDVGLGVAAGLYFLEADDTLVPLLTASCIAGDDGSCIPVEWGLVTWSADASAFALTGVNGAVVLGAVQEGALWDMRVLLKGASRYQWGLR
ncbi:MAG: hypothetical protein BWY25_01307 [Chloroflexi bacterium ADurb.Bin222]|nr:MAG: hypothetical protein BWY25_01307 [Chloroflexi bacterium ADurb.Bin222]